VHFAVSEPDANISHLALLFVWESTLPNSAYIGNRMANSSKPGRAVYTLTIISHNDILA